MLFVSRSVHAPLKAELETSWHDGDMDAVMKNGISFGRWERLVLDESLVKRQCKTTAKSTRHMPVVITWDTEQVLRDAEQWPVGTEINWSAFAREHNVPGKNRGQAVKDYLREQGVDVLRLENRTASRVRQHRCIIPLKVCHTKIDRVRSMGVCPLNSVVCRRMATKLPMKLPNAFLYTKLKSFRGVHIQLLAKIGG